MQPSALALGVLLVLAGCASAGGPAASPTTASALSSPPASGTPADGTVSTKATPGGPRVTVVEVVDGDTIRIRYPNGTRVTLRLVGVDTPEVRVENDPTEFEGVPDTDAGAACLRDEGGDASDYVTSRLLNRRVRIRFDDRAGRRDAYGRLLVYVFLDGTSVNYRLVAEGYARVYTAGDFANERRYLDAETAARSAGRGLWRCRSP